VKRPTQIAAIAGLALLLIAGLWLALRSNKQQVRYRGKSLPEWLYGQRRDFFYQTRSEAADEAFKTLGTNGLRFLISALKERGNSGLYFKLYRTVPPPIQPLLRYPISADDIQMMALEHLYRMPNIPKTIPEEWLARLAKQVPDLSNPRVRLTGLHTLYHLTRYEREPLVNLCKHLLDNPHFGIRLQAAFYLAEMGIKEPRSVPILLAALGDKEKLKAIQSINSYAYGQPPGGSGNAALPFLPGQNLADFQEMERQRVLSALEFLDAPLDRQQKSIVLRARNKGENQNAINATARE